MMGHFCCLLKWNSINAGADDTRCETHAVRGGSIYVKEHVTIVSAPWMPRQEFLCDFE
ncbi:DUF995 domain-containing protein [Gimesia sp.]|uniref:DUF995 domain-containing protein n=1 Tax=Gimesia sp. TaxID=2024833 RepID=UPI003A926E1B